jgi:hypothetical protein
MEDSTDLIRVYCEGNTSHDDEDAVDVLERQSLNGDGDESL